MVKSDKIRMGASGLHIGLFACIFASVAGMAFANFHGDGTHCGYSATDGPSNVYATVWTGTAPKSVVPGTSVAVGGGQVYGYACDATASVVCFDRSTGNYEWISPDLDTGNACAWGSFSSPVYDPTTGDVFIGSGSTLYRLSSVDGTIVWSQALPGSVMNASPLVTDTHVVIHTEGGFAPADSYICVFLNDISGTPLWSHQHGGAGANAPAYSSGVIYDLIYVSGQGSEMRAYNADTGATIWTSSDLPLAYDWAGGLALDAGYLYAPTYSFSGNGELVKVDASDGSHEWSVPIPSGDSTPVVGNGRVITVGDWSSTKVTATTTAGVDAWSGSANLGGGAGWSVSAFQAGQYLYIAPGDNWGPMPLEVLDASDGSVLSTGYVNVAGTPIVDGSDVLIPGADGNVYCLTFGTDVDNWDIY